MATFCVCHLHALTSDQLDNLHALQDAGHEIAFHSRTHPRLHPYLDKHGLDHWIKHEIDKGMAEHRAAGFPATSFAHPFHATTPGTIAACAARFKVTRARGLGTNDPTSRIYTGPTTTVDCLGSADMRNPRHPGWDCSQTLLDAIAETGGTGVFVAHDIRQTATDPGLYLTQSDLDRLLSMATKRGIGFKTLSDMAA